MSFVLLLGPTRSGKTTLMYGFSDNELKCYSTDNSLRS